MSRQRFTYRITSELYPWEDEGDCEVHMTLALARNELRLLKKDTDTGWFDIEGKPRPVWFIERTPVLKPVEPVWSRV